MISIEEAKKIIIKLGNSLNVSPKLIIELLINDLDKDDLRDGLLPISSLRAHIEVWKNDRMPDYVKRKCAIKTHN